MCIISAIPQETLLYDEDTFWACADKNPHGFGLMYVNEQDKVVVEKTMSALAFQKLLQDIHKEYNKISPIVAHYRVCTCGTKNEYNCHPFEIFPGELAYAHNGQIFSVKPGSKESDSHLFAIMLQDLDRGFINNPAIYKLITKFAGGDLMVFLDNKKQLSFINKKSWNEHEGILYSNYGFRTSQKKAKQADLVDSVKESKGDVIHLYKCHWCDTFVKKSGLIQTKCCNSIIKICMSCLVKLKEDNSFDVTHLGKSTKSMDKREFYTLLKDVRELSDIQLEVL